MEGTDTVTVEEGGQDRKDEVCGSDQEEIQPQPASNNQSPKGATADTSDKRGPIDDSSGETDDTQPKVNEYANAIETEESGTATQQTDSREILTPKEKAEKSSEKTSSLWMRIDKCYNACKTDPLVFWIMTSFTVFVSGITCALITWFTCEKYYSAQLKDISYVANSQHCSSPYSFDKHIEEMTKKLNQCMIEWNSTKTLLQSVEGRLNDMVNEAAANQTTLHLKQAIMEGEFTQITSSSIDKVWILVIVVGFVGELLLAYMVVEMWSRVKGHEGTGHYMKRLMLTRQENGTRGEDEIRGKVDILRKVRTRHLDGKVCTVSFRKETAGNHRDLLMSALNDNEAVRNVEHVAWQINKHDDILRAPSAKLYLVFVDFNERNIILEDPTKGLGDLRLTTVQAIKKMGGDLIVIYMRDVGSKNLLKGHLYNNDLTSVLSHPELKLLNSHQRILSIRDRFTDFQKSHIQEVVLENNIH